MGISKHEPTPPFQDSSLEVGVHGGTGEQSAEADGSVLNGGSTLVITTLAVLGVVAAGAVRGRGGAGLVLGGRGTGLLGGGSALGGGGIGTALSGGRIGTSLGGGRVGAGLSGGRILTALGGRRSVAALGARLAGAVAVARVTAGRLRALGRTGVGAVGLDVAGDASGDVLGLFGLLAAGSGRGNGGIEHVVWRGSTYRDEAEHGEEESGGVLHFCGVESLNGIKQAVIERVDGNVKYTSIGCLCLGIRLVWGGRGKRRG